MTTGSDASLSIARSEPVHADGLLVAARSRYGRSYRIGSRGSSEPADRPAGWLDMTAGKFGATTGGFGGTTGNRHPFDNGHGPVLVVTVLVAYLPFELLSCRKRPRNGHDRRRRAGNRRAASRYLPGCLGPWTAGRRTTSVSAPALPLDDPPALGAVGARPAIRQRARAPLTRSPKPSVLRYPAPPHRGGRHCPSPSASAYGSGRARPGRASRTRRSQSCAGGRSRPRSHAAGSSRFAPRASPVSLRGPPVPRSRHHPSPRLFRPSHGRCPNPAGDQGARCFPVPGCRSASWRTTAIDPLWQRRTGSAGSKSSARPAGPSGPVI